MTWGNGNGQQRDRREARPKSSAGTLINAAMLVIMAVTLGAGAMVAFGAVRTDVIVLQNQMVDLRAWAIKISEKVDSLGGTAKRTN
jgi:hypothetical protein